jgi:pimeloyl-ACP methyl ester carboxylesterase
VDTALAQRRARWFTRRAAGRCRHSRERGAALSQTIRFTQADDGTTLAWASAGAANNPPLVKAANWLTHLEHEWDAPIWTPLFQDLARTFRFIRYDERGFGLSDWEVADLSFETFVSDLERVVDTAGLERFALMGMTHGAAVAIEYAARHPERVSHLILFGAYAAAWRYTATAERIREVEAIYVLIEAVWGHPDASYQQLAQGFIPDANVEERRWFNELQKHATSPRNARRGLETTSWFDVRHRLSAVKAPTLVLHSRGDLVIPLSAGRELAAGLPNAEFRVLDSNNHLLLGRESAAAEFVAAVRDFITRRS